MDARGFFDGISTHITGIPIDSIIFGGDFNLTLQHGSDTTCTGHTKPCSTKELQALIHTHLLADAWWHRFPAAQGYSFYSAPHGSWSRIDRWYVTPDLLLNIQEVDHLPRTLSDHSPVLLSLTLPAVVHSLVAWRFPAEALLDTVFRGEVQDAIVEYFQINTGSVPRYATLWEAFKVYIRGICIAKQAGVLCTIRRELDATEWELDADRCGPFSTASLR